MKSMISGNQAIAYGALAAGVDVAVGYPGTPSTDSAVGPGVSTGLEERSLDDHAPVRSETGAGLTPRPSARRRRPGGAESACRGDRP